MLVMTFIDTMRLMQLGLNACSGHQTQLKRQMHSTLVHKVDDPCKIECACCCFVLKSKVLSLEQLYSGLWMSYTFYATKHIHTLTKNA